MRKQWLGISLISFILAACTTDQQPSYTAPPLPAYHGPVVEIPGIEPIYEPRNPSANNDYQVNGLRYSITKDTTHFSQIGLASIYDRSAQGNQTTSGEPFNPDAFTAAHPTLPIPSYLRVTNLANHRQLVVRINDRGPFIPGRIILLSPAAADRLNTSNNTRVRIDVINVAADGSLSGPGTIGTRVAKQNYDLPARPDLSGSMQTSSPLAENTALSPVSPVKTPAGNTVPKMPDDPLQGQNSAQPAAPRIPPAQHHTVAAANNASGFVAQVAAVNSAERASQLKTKLSQHFGVPGYIEAADGNVFRVQLGGFQHRSEAVALQQQLSAENIQSFITTRHN